MKTFQRTRCSSCGDMHVQWTILICNGNTTQWCDSCTFQLKIRIKGNWKNHIKPLNYTKKVGRV